VFSSRIFWAGACGALLIALNCAAHADESALAVHGTGTEPVRMSAADLRKLPVVHIHAAPEHRPEGDYDCASAADVLVAAGVALGKGLRGKRMAEYLRVRAADDYEVVFALPELDPDFTDKQVLLCYFKDGAALTAEEGPLRMVVPGEKRQARWVRQVTDFFIEKK
jgi:hypothetical protein